MKIGAAVETGLETGGLGLRATSEEPHDTEGPPRDATARRQAVLAVGIGIVVIHGPALDPPRARVDRRHALHTANSTRTESYVAIRPDPELECRSMPRKAVDHDGCPEIIRPGREMQAGLKVVRSFRGGPTNMRSKQRVRDSPRIS